MASKHNVIIVGLGLAGLSAANALKGRGLSILLLDENRSPGGQYIRGIPRSLGIDSRPVRERLKRVGYRLAKDLELPGVSLQQGTQIIGMEADGDVWTYTEDDRIEKHHADHIILATGARECFMPFPGWTLPGVISTGAAQLLIKSAGVLPGRNILVGGSGPLPLALAGEISAARGRVCAYWNQATWSQQLRTLTYCRHHVAKVVLGMQCMARLFVSRSPVLHGQKVLEARGNNVLEEVVLTGMSHDGYSVEGSERTFTVDCLAVGNGFVPNLELAMLAGCEIEHDSAKGGWIVKVDDSMQSSIQSIFAAGELTGIAGAEKSMIEGSIAGLTIADRLGAVNDRAVEQQELFRLQKRRQREIAFGALLNALSQPSPGMILELPDETMICRCEDINLGQIRAQIRNGFKTLDTIKKATNSGMGMCQGRTCGPIIQEIIAVYTKGMPEECSPYTVRNPVKPIRLSALADADCSDHSSASRMNEET